MSEKRKSSHHEKQTNNNYQPGAERQIKNKKQKLKQPLLQRQGQGQTNKKQNPPLMNHNKLPAASVSSNNPYSTKKEVLCISDAIALDHSYAQSFISSRIKYHPIRFLFPSENDDSANPPSIGGTGKRGRPRSATPPSSSSKLESLLKRGPSSTNPSVKGNNHLLSSSSGSSNNRYMTITDDDDEEIQVDIDSVPPPKVIPYIYDESKAKNIMYECLNNINFLRSYDVTDDNWEEQIVKTGWTKTQCSLFKQVMKVLRNDYLARLAYHDNPAEAILRRNSLDATSQRIRTILTSINWDTKLTQWLHGVLVENLSCDYLSSYLDILQTLRAKSPTLIDKMIILSTSAGLDSSTESDPSEIEKKKINAQGLSTLLKRQWDPFIPIFSSHKSKKIPGSPLFIILPCGPPFGNAMSTKRAKNFTTMLSNLGRVVTVALNTNMTSLSVSEYVYKMHQVSLTKMGEIRNSYPQKQMFLVGWGPGALLASRLSLEVGYIEGVITLGFPLINISSIRGDTDDPLLDQKTPILFIIGSRATNNSVTDMELFRKELNCETALVVLNCADDNLQIGAYHRQKLLVTQSLIDRSIIDEIRSFVCSVMLPVQSPLDKRPKLKPTSANRKKANLTNNNNNLPTESLYFQPSHQNQAQQLQDHFHPSAATGSGKTKVSHTRPSYPKPKYSQKINGKKLFDQYNNMPSASNNSTNNNNNILLSNTLISSTNSNNIEYNSLITNPRQRRDSLNRAGVGPGPVTEYNFSLDCEKFVTSNTSSSKRKASYLPAPQSQLQQPQQPANQLFPSSTTSTTAAAATSISSNLDLGLVSRPTPTLIPAGANNSVKVNSKNNSNKNKKFMSSKKTNAVPVPAVPLSSQLKVLSTFTTATMPTSSLSLGIGITKAPFENKISTLPLPSANSITASKLVQQSVNNISPSPSAAATQIQLQQPQLPPPTAIVTPIVTKLPGGATSTQVLRPPVTPDMMKYFNGSSQSQQSSHLLNRLLK